MRAISLGVGAALLVAVLPACRDDDGPETVWRVQHSPGGQGVALADGALWLGAETGDRDDPTSESEILRVDLTDGSIDRRVPVDTPIVIGEVGGTLWVASRLEPEALDPATGELGRGGLDTGGEIADTWSLAMAGGRLFGRADRVLYELDPADGSVIAPFELPPDSSGSEMEVLENAPSAAVGNLLLVDATDQGNEAIVAIDVTTGETAWSTTVERTPVGLVVADGLVWLAIQRAPLSQLVWALDAESGERVVDSRLPEGTSMLDDGDVLLRVADDGTLWLLVGADSTVFRIDTTTGEAAEQFRFSIRPTTFVVTDDAVVVMGHLADAVARVPRSEFEPVPATES